MFWEFCDEACFRFSARQEILISDLIALYYLLLNFTCLTFLLIIRISVRILFLPRTKYFLCNHKKFIFTCVLIYLLAYLLGSFIPSLLTYLSLISYIKDVVEYWVETSPKTTLRKLLTFCQGAFVIMIFVKIDREGLKTEPLFLVGVTTELYIS